MGPYSGPENGSNQHCIGERNRNTSHENKQAQKRAHFLDPEMGLTFGPKFLILDETLDTNLLTSGSDLHSQIARARQAAVQYATCEAHSSCQAASLPVTQHCGA